MNNKSRLLVFLQLVFIFFFFMTGPLFANNDVLLLIEFFSILFGCWSVIFMTRRSKLKVSPEPAQDAHLLESGPYKYIRNPMYSAVILGFAALLLDYFTPLRLLLLILLTAVFLSKISIEEKLLPEKFKDYPAYKSRTHRLIPFIY